MSSHGPSWCITNSTKEYISCVCSMWFPVEFRARELQTEAQQTDNIEGCYIWGLKDLFFIHFGNWYKQLHFTKDSLRTFKQVFLWLTINFGDSKSLKKRISHLHWMIDLKRPWASCWLTERLRTVRAHQEEWLWGNLLKVSLIPACSAPRGQHGELNTQHLRSSQLCAFPCLVASCTVFDQKSTRSDWTRLPACVLGLLQRIDETLSRTM